MTIEFRRVTEHRHRVTVHRSNGTIDSVELDTKDFLRHDLAHFAIEAELALESGVWGCVARGGHLGGDGLDGPDMMIAEQLAGPVQTLMRTNADRATIETTLQRIAPDVATPELAGRIHRRIRSLRGHWAATPFGQPMTLEWPPGSG